MNVPFRPLLMALALHLDLGAADLQIKVPGVDGAILVSLPENHDPAKSWPAVFSYHGFNGSPETARTRSHTGPRDWIVIGMAYRQRGKYELDAEGIAGEMRVFKHIRDELARTQGLDPARVHLTGYSKGGWMTDTLLQAEPGIAGAAILMGGHLPIAIKNLPPPEKKTAVFIGVGRLDPNYLPSLKGLLHYRNLGLPVSFEAWEDLGHDFPENGSRGLREWYALQNDVRPDQTALEEEFQEILKLPPLGAWSKLVDLQERPFFKIADSPWPKKISAAMAKSTANLQVFQESKIRSAHRLLLAREVRMRTLEELRGINEGYLELGTASRLRGKEIENDHRRILAVLEAAEATPVPTPERAVVEPTPPEVERRIPRNPLIR